MKLAEDFLAAFMVLAESCPGGPVGPGSPCGPDGPRGPGGPAGHAISSPAGVSTSLTVPG